MAFDITSHELFDRLYEQKCPVCELINHCTEQHMDSFLYESVNDKDLRIKIRESKGLCNYHSYMLLKMGDPLAHAIIYSDLIDNAVLELKSKKAKKHKMSYQNNALCLFCAERRDAEKRYINAFIESFKYNNFAEKYKAGALLCLPHLELAISVKDNDITEKIKRVTLQKYDALLEDLSELKRKHDYRFLDEPWTKSERKAWQKAVYVFCSKEGIR
ncbi:MAG: DUF6062 family protein [Christensenellales bacterium]